MRTTDFHWLATARPVNREAAVVAQATPQDGQGWSGVALSLPEQMTMAAGEAERLRQQIEDMGYETPLTTRAELERRQLLAAQLAHYERLSRELDREAQARRKAATRS